MEFERAVGPDNAMGEGNFLIGRPLRGDTLVDLFSRPTAGGKALALRGGGTGNADDDVEFGFCAGLEEERNDDSAFGGRCRRDVPPHPSPLPRWGRGRRDRAPLVELGEPFFANPWMENGLEFLA